MNQDTVRDTGQQDLAGIVSRFRRHLWISLAIVVVMVVLAGVATKLMTKTYSASAQLQYSPQPLLARNAQSSGDRQMSDSERDSAVDSQLQIAASPQVATRALKNETIRNNPHLQSVARGIDPTGASPEALVSALQSSVTATRVGQTNLFNIAVTDTDPIRAARTANAIAEAYIAEQANQKSSLGSSSAGNIQEQLAKRGEESQKADSAVADFRLRHNLLVDPNAPALPQSSLTDLGTQLSQARGEAALAQSRGAASGSTIVSGGIDTTALSTLRQQRAEAARDLAEATSRYGSLNPQVVDLNQRVTALDASIRNEMTSMSRSAHAESAAANARASAIAGSLAMARGKMQSDLRASAQLADLQRKADAARLLYANLLATTGQQSSNVALTQPDAQIMTRAIPPLVPSSPKMLINLLVGFALGLVVALTLAYLRERWSQTLNTIDDIDRLLGVQFLNSIPTLNSSIDKPKTRDPAEAVMLHPLSSYSEAFRSLATTLLFDARKVDTKGGRVIGISSALPREGKSTTTIAVARVLAMGATKVVIVDADLRRRSITHALAPDVTKGWIDVLNGDATLEQTMLTDASGARILPLAPGAEKGQRIFEGGGFAELLEELRNHFEVILIDTAPVLAVVDTRMMVPHFDSLVLLAYWRQTPVKAIRAALHQLNTVGGSVAGVAMTMVNLKTQAQSGYGDASYYYDEMKEYYANN